MAEAPMPPNFVWLEMPYFDRLSDAARAGMDELDALGAASNGSTLPNPSPVSSPRRRSSMA